LAPRLPEARIVQLGERLVPREGLVGQLVVGILEPERAGQGEEEVVDVEMDIIRAAAEAIDGAAGIVAGVADLLGLAGADRGGTLGVVRLLLSITPLAMSRA
jgi:hypothetical protein